VNARVVTSWAGFDSPAPAPYFSGHAAPPPQRHPRQACRPDEPPVARHPASRKGLVPRGGRAPDEKAAEAAAVARFNLMNDEQRKRVAVPRHRVIRNWGGSADGDDDADA